MMLDSEHLFLIAAALPGGLPAALAASAVMITGRFFLFGGVNAMTLWFAVSLLISGLGCGILCTIMKSYWKKWAYSLLFTVIVAICGLFYKLGSDAWPLLPHYLPAAAACGLIAAWILRQTDNGLSSLKQELAGTLRHQHGMIMKFKPIGGKLICTLADGQLLYDLGLTPERMVGASIEEIATPKHISLFRHHYERAYNGESLQFEYTIRDYTFLTSLNPIFEHGQVIEVISTSSDITRRKQMESALMESEERYRKLIEFLPDGIIIHCEGKIVQVNQKTIELLDASDPAELIGLSIRELLHSGLADEVIAEHHEILKNRSSVPPTERIYNRLDGQQMNVEASAAWISYKGKPAVMTVFRDITIRKKAELQLHEANEMFKKLSMIDGLTGIANRRYFEETYREIWDQALRHSAAVSVILLDIDFFKVYNDTYGHQGGDICLKKVAAALDLLAQADGYFAARYGGEEFICILPDANERKAREFAAKVYKEVESMAIPHVQSRVSGQVTVSIGIASAIPARSSDRKELIEHADRALYKAKTNGRNQIAS